jgi:hypothetical protein
MNDFERMKEPVVDEDVTGFLFLSDDAEADAYLLSFPVLLDFADSVPDAAVFLSTERDRLLTRKEKEWVQEAKKNPEIAAAPPSAPALRSLQKNLEKYAGPMPATKEQWQNYLMKQYFVMSQDPDPKISKPALDALAKTNIVGLHTDVQEININTRSTIELEATLAQKLQQIIQKKNTTQEEPIEAEWSEAE